MNNKKIIISILVLIVLILSIVLFNKNAARIEDAGMMATTTNATTTKSGSNKNPSGSPAAVASNPTGNYENGTYSGYIKKSAITSNKLILTVDFIQTFDTKKAALIAAIQDDVCHLPSNMGIRSKEEFIARVENLKESEIEDYNTTQIHCFTKGVVYTRNPSAETRSKEVAKNFTAQYISYPSYAYGNTTAMGTLNTAVNATAAANYVWKITVKDNLVTDLQQIFTR